MESSTIGGPKELKKDLEKEHKKALTALEKTLTKKQQKKIEPTKTNKKKKRKKTLDSTKKTRLKAPEKITPRKIIWILLEFFIIVTVLLLFFVTATGNINIELFFISIFIGIVTLKELTDEFTPNHLKKKINILISGFLIIFFLIVINEIISLIST